MALKWSRGLIRMPPSSLRLDGRKRRFSNTMIQSFRFWDENDYEYEILPILSRADKGWAVKRARPSKKVWCSGLGLCLEISLVFDFGQGLRYDVVCTLDTAAVTELWRLELFPCTSSSFLWAGTLSPRGKCCYFCGRFSWSRQTSLSKGFSYYFHDSTSELYFRSTTPQCRCYSTTKTTKYYLKHEGKSHVIHGKTTRQQIVFHNSMTRIL